MVVVPGVPPGTIPVAEPTLAIAVLAELHVPPDGVEPRLVDEPEHTLVVPVIAVGRLLIVIVTAPLMPLTQPVVGFVPITV